MKIKISIKIRIRVEIRLQIISFIGVGRGVKMLGVRTIK